MLNIFTQIFAFVGFVAFLKATLNLLIKGPEGRKELNRISFGTIVIYSIGLLLFMVIINYINWGINIVSEEKARQIKYTQVEDEREIFSKYNDFVRNLLMENYDWAFEDMSPAYRHKNSLEDFKLEFSKSYVPLLIPEPRLEISSSKTKASLYPDYDIYGPVLDQSFLIVHMEKVEDTWYLTGEIDYILD